MNPEVAEAIGILKAQGISVEVDVSNALTDVYTATLPDGERFDFLAAGLLKLRADRKLTVEGIKEAGSKPA